MIETKLSVKEIERLISISVRYPLSMLMRSASWLRKPHDKFGTIIFVLTPPKYATMMRSFEDLGRFQEKCYHDAEQIYQFFYVLPFSIKEKAIELFRTHQREDAYIRAFGISTEYREALPAIIFYNDDGQIVERTRFNGHLYGHHRKLFIEEKLTITRLLSIRYWNLRMNEHEKD